VSALCEYTGPVPADMGQDLMEIGSSLDRPLIHSRHGAETSNGDTQRDNGDAPQFRSGHVETPGTIVRREAPR